MIYWALLLMGTVFEIVGDVFFKKSHYGMGFGMYLVGTIFWAFSLRYDDLSSAIIVFTLLNVIGAVLMSHFYLGETIALKQVIGIGLAIGAIVLIET